MSTYNTKQDPVEYINPQCYNPAGMVAITRITHLLTIALNWT